MANFKLSKQSSEGEIQAYFTSVLELVKLNEKFPVNLEDVWPLVYNRKEEAVRALKSDDLFMQDVDYQVLRKNAERSDEPLHQNGERSANGQFNGANKVTYMLSVPCLEFFIARRVRPVFEVYRKIFHMTMGEAEAQVDQTRKQQQLESLAEMGIFFSALTFHSTVDEYCHPIISARKYFEYVYTGDMKGRDFDKWMSDRCVYGPLKLRLHCVKMKRPSEWDPKPEGQDYALSLMGLARLAEYESDLFAQRDKEKSSRARSICNHYDDCMVKLDQQDEPYTLTDVVVEMRSFIYGHGADALRVPHSSRLFDGEYAPDACAPALIPRHDYAVEHHHTLVLEEVEQKAQDAWGVFEVADGGARSQGVDLASPSLTTEEVCRSMKRFDDEMMKRFAAAADRERAKDGKGEIAAVRDDYRTAFYSLRRALCNLVFIEHALVCDYPDTAAADQTEAGKEAAV